MARAGHELKWLLEKMIGTSLVESLRGSSERALEPLLAMGQLYGFLPISHLKLLENIMHVVLHGKGGNKQAAGNLLVAQPLGDQRENLSFAGRELADGRTPDR